MGVPLQATTTTQPSSFTAMDGINATQGLASLISGLRRKKPVATQAAVYKALLRPIRGNQSFVDQSMNAIDQEKRSAVADVNRTTGSDVNLNLAARLGIQANSDKARESVQAKNAELIQADEQRFANEYNQQELVNTQLKEQDRYAKDQRTREDYEAGQERARTGLQRALQYENERQANQRSNAQRIRQFNDDLDIRDAVAANDLELELIRQGKSSEQIASILGSYKGRFAAYKRPLTK